MSYSVLIYYPLLALLLLWGAKKIKKGEWNDGFLSLEQTKCFLGFLAVIIIFHHLSQQVSAPYLKKEYIIHGLDPFVSVGYLAVSVFLFCSGFGMLKSFKSKENYFDNYFKVRIFPILLTFAITEIAYLVVRHFYLAATPFTTIFTTRGIELQNPVGWFVLAILYLYFIFYVAFHKIKNRKISFLILLLGTILYFVFCDSLMYGNWWYNTIHMFLIGVLAAEYEEKITTFLKKHYNTVLVVSIALTIVFFLISDNFDTFRMAYGIKYVYSVERICVLVSQMLCGFTFTCSIFIIGLKVKIGNKPLAFLGKMTLPLYLTQSLFINLFGRSFIYDDVPSLYYITSVPLYVLAVLICTFISAFILYIAVKYICIWTTKLLNILIAAFKRKIKRNLIVLGSILGLIIIYFGASYISLQGESQKNADKYAKANVNFVDTVGGKMGIRCYGEGSKPIVVWGDIESPSTIVVYSAFIEESLAMNKDLLFVSFDYPGQAFSSSLDCPGSSDMLADQVHEALKNANIEGPYMFITHKASDIPARYFINKYPDEVAGILSMESYVDGVIPLMCQKNGMNEGEFERYNKIENKRLYRSQRILDFFQYTNFEITYANSILLKKNSAEDKRAFESVYGKYQYNKPCCKLLCSFFDDLTALKDEKLPENLPAEYLLSYALANVQNGFDGWTAIHENQITNADIQRITVVAGDGNFPTMNPDYVSESVLNMVNRLNW